MTASERGAAAVAPVLLPGNMCDARLWRGGRENLVATLARHFGRAPSDADLSDDSSIAQMAARVLDGAEGQLVPIGFSMSAIVAVEMACQAPDRVAGLVLLGYDATANLSERAAHRPAQQAEVGAGGLERVLVEELKPCQIEGLRDQMGIAAGDEWHPRWGLGDNARSRVSAFVDGSQLKAKVAHREFARVPVSNRFPVPESEEQSTQTAFGKILLGLAKSGHELADHVVTTSPDVTVSTNHAWVNQRSLFRRKGMADVFAAAHRSAQKWQPGWPDSMSSSASPKGICS